MDKVFLKAVEVYNFVVEEACMLLLNYLEKKQQIVVRNKYGLYDYLNRSHKFEIVVDDKKYIFHGSGCTVLSNDTSIIDWDFGCRSWWCGIQPFKMAQTLKKIKFTEKEYYDGDHIKGKCEQYLSEGFLYYYKGQYYIDMIRLKCKRVEFPVDYDKMAVHYKGISRVFLRCKNIDRFIRKSNLVYEGISALKDNYILIFYKNDKEITKVPYNDIAYPYAAVKIMNEEIIKPHVLELWKKT